MEHILRKKQIIDSTYEVQFFISGNALYQKYRVKGKDGKTYLLKLYNSSKLSSNSFSKGNLLEVEILAFLIGGNIIKLVNNGEIVKDNQKFHFIIFDFISGETLQDKLKRDGAFSSYSAVPLIIELLESLDKIHNHPKTIIHNNINPNCISLDYSENKEKPILTDFGFARYITSKSNSIDLKQLSPFFIAPELYNGIFTPQSDIFSTGAMLYNLIIGLPPWYVEIPSFQHTEEKFINAINEKRNEQLNFGVSGLDEFDDEHLKETIKKALALNVDERFKNADEFIKALKREVVLDRGNEKKSTTLKVVKKKGAGFNGITGMSELKELLTIDVINALKKPEEYKRYGVSFPNGILFYGPPRCGKTFFAKKFAEEVGYNYVYVKPSTLKSRYVNATQENIAKMFEDAEKDAPTIIFIDELNELVPNRDSGVHEMALSAVNEMLAQMDRTGEKGIFIIGATNYPNMIDPAILGAGRIEKKFYIGPPDFILRKSLFENYLKNKPIDFGIDYDKLSTLTQNYVTGDIELLVNEAAKKAMLNKQRITMEILEQIIKQQKPTVKLSELKKYEAIRQEIEEDTKEDDANNKPKFGFE